VRGLDIGAVVADVFDHDSTVKALDDREPVLNLATRRDA
jgi:hypothetical protein